MVEKAIVRWVKPHAFGIRIIEMQPVHAARLRRIVTLLEQQSLGPAESPPLPPGQRADPPAPKS
jgi:hypothetical protein